MMCMLTFSSVIESRQGAAWEEVFSGAPVASLVASGLLLARAGELRVNPDSLDASRLTAAAAI
jgi:hypothetical protein